MPQVFFSTEMQKILLYLLYGVSKSAKLAIQATIETVGN